jgi:hypothetical protein
MPYAHVEGRHITATMVSVSLGAALWEQQSCELPACTLCAASHLILNVLDLHNTRCRTSQTSVMPTREDSSGFHRLDEDAVSHLPACSHLLHDGRHGGTSLLSTASAGARVSRRRSGQQQMADDRGLTILPAVELMSCCPQRLCRAVRTGAQHTKQLMHWRAGQSDTGTPANSRRAAQGTRRLQYHLNLLQQRCCAADAKC